jgi:hypothetical protein
MNAALFQRPVLRKGAHSNRPLSTTNFNFIAAYRSLQPRIRITPHDVKPRTKR